MNIKLIDGSFLDRLPDAAETAALVVLIEDDADLRGYEHPLAALTNIGGSAYLRGYAHPLAALTNIGGSADLRGYAHADSWPWLINGGADRRGYYFTGILKNREWRICAGCRDFSIERALRHWGSGGISDKPDCLVLVERIVAEATARRPAEAA